MRTFIIKTTFFILPILVIVLPMEILLRNIPNDYLYKKKYLDKHSPETETLILGSSHSFYGFNPENFTSTTFNASHVSQSLYYDFEMLKKYQNNFNNLKTVVLPISYFTLFSKIEEGPESWRVKNYVIYYGMTGTKSMISYSEIFSNQLKVNILRLYKYYIAGELNVPCTKLGWGTNYKSENAKNLVETGKDAAKRHTKDNIYSQKYQQIYKDNIQTLNSIVKWCADRNIKLLLLTPPAYKTYRTHLNIEQLKTTVETINEIATNKDNCIYINLLDDSTFVAKDFYDADHLSEVGAEKLSKLIDKKINEWK